MSIRRIVGGCMVASPFACMFVIMTAQRGIWFAVSVFATTALIAAVLKIGVDLSLQ